MSFNSKINLLALSRRNELNMRCLLPDEGNVFIFSDLEAAEPTVSANLIGDDVQIYQIFEGKGKAPYYRDDGLLMISDPYLALASVNPVSAKTIEDMYYNELFDGLPFWDAWVKDPDLVKNHKTMKVSRNLNKPAYLGLNYGLKGDTPDRNDSKHGLRNHMIKEGYPMNSEQAWETYNRFWDMYKKTKEFGASLESAAKRGVPLYNPLGFKLTGKPKDMLNRLIQSSVSSIISLAEYKLEDMVGDKFSYVACIHDEVILEVKEEDAEEVLNAFHTVASEITELLKFKYPIRFTPQIARDFYEGK